MLQLLSCGNDWVGADEDQRKSCYSLDGVDDGRIGPAGLSWKIHSQFTEDLFTVLGQTAVTLTDIGTYILGEKTSQFLLKGSHVWVEGPEPAIDGKKMLGEQDWFRISRLHKPSTPTIETPK